MLFLNPDSLKVARHCARFITSTEKRLAMCVFIKYINWQQLHCLSSPWGNSKMTNITISLKKLILQKLQVIVQISPVDGWNRRRLRLTGLSCKDRRLVSKGYDADLKRNAFFKKQNFLCYVLIIKCFHFLMWTWHWIQGSTLKKATLYFSIF